jgi:DNA-binding CsgD family transcriptional regulator
MKDLSPREEQIIWMVAKGTTTPDIARILHITQPTTRNHIQNIMLKTGTHTRLAAVHAWKTRKPDHAGRILDYCKEAGIKLSDKQTGEIRAMFQEHVRCEDGSHKIPAGETSCECKLLTSAVPQT